MLNFLPGKKTFIVSLASIVLGILKIVWPEIPIEASPEQLIIAGAGFGALRAGVAGK